MASRSYAEALNNYEEKANKPAAPPASERGLTIAVSIYLWLRPRVIDLDPIELRSL